MTIKEIAELTGKTKRSVELWIKLTCEKNSQISEKISQAEKTKKPADFTLDETISILRAGKISEGLISLFIKDMSGKKSNEIVPCQNKHEYMTVRQIAELFNAGTQTVRDWIKKIPNGIREVENGIESKFTLSETIEILRAGKISEGIINLLIENANKNAQVPMQNEQVNYVTKTEMKDFVLAVITPILSQQNEFNQKLLHQIQSPVKQIEIIQDYYSLKAYCIKNNVKQITLSELKLLGKEAVKISDELSKEIRKVDDEQWGKVNSYHIDVLKIVFER